MSFNELCKVFGVEGKLNIYKQEYNSIILDNNKHLIQELELYAIQDCIALYQSLLKAQVAWPTARLVF